MATSYTASQNNVTVNQTGHLTDHDDISTNIGYALGLQPSGDTSGTADTAAINNLLAAGGGVRLFWGTFWVNAPLIVPTGTTLRGAHGSTTSVYDAAPPSKGTIIKAATGWATSDSPAGVIEIEGSSVHLQDFFIDGTNITQAGVQGIVDTVSSKPVFLSNIGVYNVTGHGIQQQGSAWHLYTVVVCTTATGDGFHGGWTDSVLVNCHAQTCGVTSGTSSGFYITSAPVKIVACRGDLSQYGFTVAGGASNSTYQDIVQLTGCGTQRNNGDGYRIRNAQGTTGNPPVVMSGCSSDLDGANGTLSAASQGSITGGTGGGNFAGIHMYGPGVLLVSGFTNTCGTRDTSGTACPQYGLRTDTTWSSGADVPDLIAVTGSFLVGNTAGVNDNAPSTKLSLDSSVWTYAGGQYKGAANGEYPSPGKPLASPVHVNQQAPPITSSTSLVMAGFGTTPTTFTPLSTGNVAVSMSGAGYTATGTAEFNVAAYYGSGTAPSGGTPQGSIASTRWGSPGAYNLQAGGIAGTANTAWTFTSVLGLTVGTAYWFDAAYNTTVAADSAGLTNVGITIYELPAS